jgi:fucokinase
MNDPWDYLIVTASNEAQAEAYEAQLKIRRDLGLVSDVRELMVVADPHGKRIGSGGSTLCCLMEVLNVKTQNSKLKTQNCHNRDVWEQILRKLRILIIHAGGDSKRLPAYGPCGKIFVPVPGESDSALCLSLFDRQLPIYLALPQPAAGKGQIVITSGDVLLRFDPSQVSFAAEGVTGLACYAQPEQASRHGVFCRGQAGEVRLYLQKPSIADQQKYGAIDAYGQACLDIGVMSFDAATAVKMLEAFGVRPAARRGQGDRKAELTFAGETGKGVLEKGVDFYREICCAMGSQARKTIYMRSAKSSGSKWDKGQLEKLFQDFSRIPFSVQLLRACDFLDFGATRAIMDSGARLLQADRGISARKSLLDINNEIRDAGSVEGPGCWVEGCRISSSLSLDGENVVVGVDIDEPICLPAKTCLDVIKGRSRNGEDVWFVRCYGVDDMFNETVGAGATFCGMDVLEWLEAVRAKPKDVWDAKIPARQRSVWNARLFPAVKAHNEYRRWLWMLDVAGATDKDAEAWQAADRYSPEEILALTNHRQFYERRKRIRANIVKQSLRRMFRPESELSATELAYLLDGAEDLSDWVCEILTEARRHFANGEAHGIESLVFPRIIHTLGSALAMLKTQNAKLKTQNWQRLGPAERDWLRSVGLDLAAKTSVAQWASRAQSLAFEALQNAIVTSGAAEDSAARCALRSDEIVWARAPARLDVGGGWTDTPPYSLEHGGCVVNAAVNLNSQPPIQAYLRVINEPVIRIGSIDRGIRIEINSFDQLLDYRDAVSDFALAKAALVLSGVSPRSRAGRRTSLRRVLEQFGGGIELTTLAAIPKGSGLGTSSIMGAVIVAAIQRAMGRGLSRRDLFHSVLRLEQALTTGGGWQDQIGGAVDGVKMIVTEPGLIPDAKIHYVPCDVLDPKANGGRSLLYYTGVTRLAKDILQQVVGRYLNRDRRTMVTLRRIRQVATEVADALIRKDIEEFGRLVDAAWQLNKRLDPNSTNEEIEALIERVKPQVFGAKLLGAGGGGFLLMICKSPEDAALVRQTLEAEPPNDRARFFDFDVSSEGLTVTVC